MHLYISQETVTRKPRFSKQFGGKYTLITEIYLFYVIDMRKTLYVVYMLYTGTDEKTDLSEVSSQKIHIYRYVS